MIKTFIIKYIAGNLDKLIDFLSALDKQIDTFVDAEAKKQADLISEQVRLFNEQKDSEARTNTALNLKGGLQGLTQTNGVSNDTVLRA
jgi:hypothetical protein